MKRKLRGFLRSFSFFAVFLTVTSGHIHAQDTILKDLTPVLSVDSLTMDNAVSPLVMVDDPDPNARGKKAVGWSAAQTLSDPNVAAATAATFSITYVPAGQGDVWYPGNGGALCQDFPAQAKTAFEAAAAIWANQFHSPVPITIRACWASLASPNTLGYSGGGSVHRDFVGVPRAGTWYSAALANSLAGSDLAPTQFDMHITYNSNFSWYFGTDGQPPLDQHDLVTVAAHEIAHGLNFSGSANYSSGVGSYGNGTGYPNIYDTYMQDASGTALISYDNNSTALGSLLTSDNLWFHGTNAMAANGGLPVKIYAPASWSSGSSYSHLDYGTFNGTSNSMMTYAIGAGSANHNPGPVNVGLLKDLGWQTATPKCATPSSLIVPVADADGNYTVNWGASTTAGVFYELQEATNSAFTTGLRTIAAESNLSESIADRAQDKTYYYRVRAVKSSYDASAWRYAGNSCAVPGIASVGIPSSLTVPVADADGSYSVRWGASVTSGVIYELVEATDSMFNTGSRIAFRGTATSCTIAGRNQNVTYYYRVRAMKGGLIDSGYRTATSGCAVPGTAGVVMPVSIAVPVADADGAYTISWTASATAGAIYELQEATNSVFTSGLRTAYRGTSLSKVITGRSQNITYYYRVRAVKGGLMDSSYRLAINGCAVPGTASASTPASLTVPTADADGAYLISWGASATAGVIYELQEATSYNFTTGVRNVYRGTATGCAVTGRSQNVTYYYHVRAIKPGYRDSAYRGSNSCAVPGTGTTGIPAGLTVPLSDADGAYQVSWEASATADVIYELQEAANNTFTAGLRNVYRGTATSCNITGRLNGNTYYYRVRAVKGGLKDSAFQKTGNGCAVSYPVLADAVDNSAYSFSTGGNANWFYQTAVSTFDGDAAQSGVTPNNGTSWMQTTVTGPGSGSFYWKVSSELNWDYLRFYIDDVEQDKISGTATTNWAQITFALGSGPHVLKWAYTKDDSDPSDPDLIGNDAGWVDYLVFN
jgi:hypothetical protein